MDVQTGSDDQSVSSMFAFYHYFFVNLPYAIVVVVQQMQQQQQQQQQLSVFWHKLIQLVHVHWFDRRLEFCLSDFGRQNFREMFTIFIVTKTLP